MVDHHPFLLWQGGVCAHALTSHLSASVSLLRFSRGAVVSLLEWNGSSGLESGRLARHSHTAIFLWWQGLMQWDLPYTLKGLGPTSPAVLGFLLSLGASGPSVCMGAFQKTQLRESIKSNAWKSLGLATYLGRWMADLWVLLQWVCLSLSWIIWWIGTGVSWSFGFLGFLLELASGLLILLTNLVEFLHVLKELWASLEGDEKFGLLAVAAVVGGLYCDGLRSDLQEGGVVVSITTIQMLAMCPQTKDKIALISISDHTLTWQSLKTLEDSWMSKLRKSRWFPIESNCRRLRQYIN